MEGKRDDPSRKVADSGKAGARDVGSDADPAPNPADPTGPIDSRIEDLPAALEGALTRRTKFLHGTLSDLQASKQLLRRIVDNSLLLILTVDHAGRVLTSNQSDILPPVAPDVIGRKIFDWLPESQHGPTAENLRTVFEHGQHLYEEIYLEGRGWFGSHLSPILDDGRTVAATLIVQDITSRREAEEHVRKSEALFREIADSTPAMIWLLDPKIEDIWVNRALKNFIGEDYGELSDIVHPTDNERYRRFFASAFEKREPYDAELLLRSALDDTYRPCQLRAIPRFRADGTFLGYLGSCVDMSELRAAEALAVEAQEKFAHSLRVESLDQLTLGLAHELHQPLASIATTAGAALRSLATDTPNLSRVREMIEEVQRQSLRAGALVDHTRESIRKERREPTELCLAELTREVVKLTAAQAARRGFRIKTQIPEHRVPRQGDGLQLQQVLINLVNNAIAAMESASTDGVVEITLDQPRLGEATLCVRDFGPGLTDEVRDHMFDTYFTTRPAGLGMGLAICKSIVEAHGGSLAGENHPGGGAIFRITLPE